jgi:hypothetical protein
MTIRRSVRKRLRLPGRAALMLGLGALSTLGARADAQAGQTVSDDVLIRNDGEKIYLSEGGRETELRLGPTLQRERLLRLLKDHGPAGVKVDRDPRLIMSGGGGTGFSLRDLRKSFTEGPAARPQDPPQVTAPAIPDSDPGTKRSTPGDRGSAADKRG